MNTYISGHAAPMRKDCKFLTPQEAWKYLDSLANGRRLLFGVGNTNPPDAVVAIPRDGLNDGRGYMVYETGDGSQRLNWHLISY